MSFGNFAVGRRGASARRGASGTPVVQKRLNTSARNILLKVVILGNGGVGKSCLMHCFVSNKFDLHSLHTIGVDFLTKDLDIGGETYTLQIWDTNGQERFKSLRTPFYRGSDVCLLTYAVDDHKSFYDIPLWYKEFLTYADVKEGTSFPFILVGNKENIVQGALVQADVTESDRQVTHEEAASWCQANGNLPFIETSAKDATNVALAFRLAVEEWTKFEAKMEQPYKSGIVDLRSLQKSPKKLSCCMNSGRMLKDG